jgi:methionine-rich copper-binding protein CopC
MKLIAVVKKLVMGAGLLGALAMLPSLVLAHTALTASLPGNAAVVSSPEKLELTFGDEVRMLRLTLVHGAAHNIDFGFQPTTAAARTFSYNLPSLMLGEHTVTWTVIGPDGHTVSGDFKFSVSADGAAAQTQEHNHGGHSHGGAAHGHDAGHNHDGGHQH